MIKKVWDEPSQAVESVLLLMDGISITNIYDNDIGTDFFDVFVGNHIFRFTAKESGEFITAGNNDFADLAGAFVKFQISDLPQTFAIL